jgi:hypothetical protein
VQKYSPVNPPLNQKPAQAELFVQEAIQASPLVEEVDVFESKVPSICEEHLVWYLLTHFVFLSLLLQACANGLARLLQLGATSHVG